MGLGEANRREELIIYNFEEGRDAEVVKGEKFLSDDEYQVLIEEIRKYL